MTRSAADEVSAATSLPALNALFKTRIAKWGFDAFAGGALSGAAPTFFLLDWPKSWLELYAHQGFAADDVVVATAMLRPRPFTWAEIRRERPGASERIFAAAATFGWRDGLAVPVHGPGEERGVVSLAARLAVGEEAKAHAVVWSLAAYERARALHADGSDASKIVRLSARERQALVLVAEGCSDHDIAARLGVAKTTAHFHVEQARRKLGASTRAQAVAVALVRRLL